MKRSIIVIMVSILNAIVVQAAYIDWEKPTTISSNRDISNKGRLLYAYYFTSNDSDRNLTINGVTFNSEQVHAAPSIPGKNKTLDADIVFHNWDRGTSIGYFKSAEAPFVKLSSKYQALLTDGQWTATSASSRLTEGNSISIELRNLVEGQKYLVQIWGNDSRASGGRDAVWSYADYQPYDAVTLDLNAAENNAEGGLGQYVIGTFTAEGTTQTIYLIGGNSANLSAIQVRKIQ